MQHTVLTMLSMVAEPRDVLTVFFNHTYFTMSYLSKDQQTLLDLSLANYSDLKWRTQACCCGEKVPCRGSNPQFTGNYSSSFPAAIILTGHCYSFLWLGTLPFRYHLRSVSIQTNLFAGSSMSSLQGRNY